jgi:N-acetylmuramic acid 6-phosphate etherase
MNGRSPQERALEFLRVAHLFQLGHLPTEQPHPRTARLSHWARNDLPTAIAALKNVDLRALHTLKRYAPEIDELGESIKRTLSRGRRIFLCGCGATGRLALSLEFLWRQERGHGDEVVSFMAGGDVALVQSLEGFEDHPAYGARHLQELGFEDGDLLISCTEGGETPYVIGATERAAEISRNAPYFLYCNADSILVPRIERFRRVYENPRINKICLYVGPMALAGSTRMQASTVLQLAVGAALLHPERPAIDVISLLHTRVRETDFEFLAGFIEGESEIYEAGDHVHYVVTDFGITVFTDTTERAPTFSLVPFEQLHNGTPDPSLCYVSLADAGNPGESWVKLLNRGPRPLNWPEIDPRTASEHLRGYDFSMNALAHRRRRVAGRTHHEFDIRKDGDRIVLALGARNHGVPIAGLPILLQHLVLKQMLNIHSTLVMGRLGRYENNLMTWVAPTNGKLVDRAIRYVGHLLAESGRTERRYEEIARQIFTEMDRTPPGESLVLRTYRSLVNGLR